MKFLDGRLWAVRTAIGLRPHKRGIWVQGVDFNQTAARRWRDLCLEADFGNVFAAEFVAKPPFRRAEWMVSAVLKLSTGLSHEDTRRTFGSATCGWLFQVD